MLNFLKSKIRKKVLAYYFSNPQTEKYLRELAREIGEDPSNLRREMAKLTKEGLFITEKKGQEIYYKLNEKFPLYEEIKNIISKTTGIEHELKKAVLKIRGLKNAYLYGSFAKGQEEAESDIDLLLIGEHSSIKAIKALLPLQSKLKREINSINMTEKEFAAKKRKKDEFIENIFNDKIIKLK